MRSVGLWKLIVLAALASGPTTALAQGPAPAAPEGTTRQGAIEDAITNFAASLPLGTRLLDAGAGEGRYAAYFNRQRYCGVDLGVGDPRWNYAGLDVVADLTALPFRQGTFHAAIHIVTLEHLR